MEVEPKRIYRWLKGEVSPRLDEVDRFAQAIEQPLVIRVGSGQTKTPPPDWAGALMTRDEVKTYVESVKGEVLTAIREGRTELRRELGKEFGKLAAEELRRQLAPEDPPGTPDQPPAPPGPQPKPSA